MLLELRIGNMALAEDVVLKPGPGLTVLTGETGAGKSLVAGALALLAGGRADRGIIRRGEDTAWVEAVCDLDARPDLVERVRDLGVPLVGDDLLVLRRELHREGRSRVLINGNLSSQAVLERLGTLLFVIQSQNQHRELATTGFARDLLDAVLGLGGLRSQVAGALKEYEQAAKLLAERKQEAGLAAEQLDMWRYQRDELTRASLDENEEQELVEAIGIKRHARALQDAAATAREHLDHGPAPARETLGAALAALESHADKSPRLTDALQQLQAAADLLADASTELDRFLDAFEVDPRGLDELEERKALYEELRRKYRRDVPALLTLATQLTDRLERQDQALDDLDQLENAVTDRRDDLVEACRELHEARIEGAPRFAAAAEEAIRPLALPDLDVVLQVDPDLDAAGALEVAGARCHVAAHGADRVRLLVRTNPGEALGEAGTIASGGETARIFLGLSILARSAPAPLLRLFDEVDAGLGMDSATPVALLLRRLAADGQALCITHLPTVSVHADHHWRVSKQVDDGRTTVDLQPLDGDERVEEVARQLGGEGWRRDDTAAQAAYARELLEAAAGAVKGRSRAPAKGRAES